MYNHKDPWKKYSVSMLYYIAEPDKAYDKCHHLLIPFKSNETSHFYQMDQSFFVFRVLGCCFSFLFIFNRTSCKQTVENLIRTLQYVASDLGLYYSSMSHKKNACLIWVNIFVVYITHISCIVSSSNWIMIGYIAVLTI